MENKLIVSACKFLDCDLGHQGAKSRPPTCRVFEVNYDIFHEISKCINDSFQFQ